MAGNAAGGLGAHTGVAETTVSRCAAGLSRPAVGGPGDGATGAPAADGTAGRCRGEGIVAELGANDRHHAGAHVEAAAGCIAAGAAITTAATVAAIAVVAAVAAVTARASRCAPVPPLPPSL